MFRNLFPGRAVRTIRRDRRASRPFSRGLPVEILEARKLMAILTDVSQIAALSARHSGPTNLYINFDGGTVPNDPVNNPSGASQTIRSFETEGGDASLNRERDIQQILFQVAEVYAPFDVEVHRIVGAGKYGTGPGDTTVFVGGNEADSTQSGALFTKYSYSQTPGASSDYPRVGHAIDSDPYDVAFMDPVVGSTYNPALRISGQQTERGATNSVANIFDIVRSIAHEAGHTFGLSHVRTDGLADPTPLKAGTVNDIMSYDSTNQYFADQNLTLTSANNSGLGTTFTGSIPNYLDTTSTVIHIGPITIPIPIARNLATQNSFLTLEDILGVRPTDEYANVANSSLVDPVYGLLGSFHVGPGAAPKVDLSHTATQFGNLSRLGDDQVFTITPTTSGLIDDNITVHPFIGNLRPELLIYDSTGSNLLGYADPSANGTASYTLPDGASYQVVVASQDGNSTGSYWVGVSSVLNIPISPIHFNAVLAATISTGTISPAPASSSGLGAQEFVPLTVSMPTVTLTSIEVPRPGQFKPSLV